MGKKKAKYDHIWGKVATIQSNNYFPKKNEFA